MGVIRLFKRAVPAGIGGRFVAFAVLCVVGTLAAVGSVATWTAQRAVEQEIYLRNQEHVRSAARQVATVHEGVVRELQLATQAALGISGELSTHPLEQLLARAPLIRHVEARDAGGQLRLLLPEGHTSDPDIPPSAWEKVAWSRVPHFTTMSEGGGHLFLVLPLLGPQERFKGMAGAELDREALSDLLVVRDRTDGTFAFLVDGQGGVIARAGQVPGSLPSLRGTVFGETLRREEAGTAIGKLGGQEVLIAYQPVPRMGWALVVGRPAAAALQPVKQVTWVLLQGILTVVGLGLAFSWLGSRRVTRPLARLTALATHYGRGELWHRVEVSGDDEVARLARTMNDMGSALDEERARVIGQQKYLQDILQSLPLAVMIVDSSQSVVGWNRAAIEMTGYGWIEVAGLSLARLPLGTPLVRALLVSLEINDRDDMGVETALTNRAGEQRLVRVYTSRLVAQGGAALGTVAILADVTEIKQLESLVRRSERLAALGQLTAGLAHELKNPLAVLSALNQTILEETAASEVDPFLLQEMGKEIGRMDALLGNLLDVGREGGGRRELLSPGAEIERLLTLLRPRLRNQKVQVQQHHFDDPPFVLADRAKLRQVFLNLLVNSLEAMPNGGILTIAGVQKWRGSQLYVGVRLSDTGPGIPEKHLELIFNPFFSSKQSGTGLGLSVVHEIMTQHGGEVLVQSRPGEGTAFTCWFPAANQPDKPGGQGE